MNKHVVLPIVLVASITVSEVAPVDDRHHATQHLHVHQEPTVILQAQAAVQAINVAAGSITHRVSSSMSTPFEVR